MYDENIKQGPVQKDKGSAFCLLIRPLHCLGIFIENLRSSDLADVYAYTVLDNPGCLFGGLLPRKESSGLFVDYIGDILVDHCSGVCIFDHPRNFINVFLLRDRDRYAFAVYI
jgi:hypothetical protein